MNVLVLLNLTDARKARLEAAAPQASFHYAATGFGGAGLSLPADAVDPDELAAADAIVGNIDPAALAGAGRLKLLQLNSAGYDNYLASGMLAADTVLVSASGAYGQAVSEHLFAMVLGLMKRLPAYRDGQARRAWDDLGPVSTFRGARVAVLGTGDIGSHFAQLAKAFGATTIGLHRHEGGAGACFDEAHAMDALPRVLADADVVASFLPSTPATRGLADEAFFTQMKPGAYFANGGRGDLVDQDALVAALSSGHLAGAALDVTTPEPLPANHPLWAAPNAFITPHISGGFHLSVVLDNVVDIAARSLSAFAAGEPVPGAVSRAR